MSSQLGKLMVDMLVESEQWILDIMAFFSIFVKLKDTTTAKAFKVEMIDSCMGRYNIHVHVQCW